jgi:glycosyltransferase involved in cell wall biosynthesis
MTAPAEYGSGGITVSVVVPTRDRPAALARCLASLAAQDRGPDEIVVVDDASVDGGAVAAVVATVPSAHLVAGEGRGPAAARNRGAAAATGDVVCFLDDDCAATPGWVDGLVTGLARPDGERHVVAGRTVADPPGDPFAAASQAITNHLLLDSLDAAADTVTFAPTCNIACWRGIALRFPFDEAFPLAAGEDREWCSRLTDAGVAIHYAPAATVLHRPGLDARRFLRQQSRYGRGARHWRASSCHPAYAVRCR